MSLLNLLQYSFCFMFWFFEVCGILVPRPGIEPATPGLEDEVSTTGPPGKAFEVDFILKKLKKKKKPE